MHEYSLMAQVVEEIQTQLGAGTPLTGRIRNVHLTVGQLDIHAAEAFRQAFQMASLGTRLEGAELDLTVVPATVACPACGFRKEAAEGELDSHDPSPYVPCPRCGAVCAVEGGRGIRRIELSVEDSVE